MPPNGYNCRCSSYVLTPAEMKAEGISITSERSVNARVRAVRNKIDETFLRPPVSDPRSLILDSAATTLKESGMGRSAAAKLLTKRARTLQ